MLFVLFVIGLIFGPTPEEREQRQMEREQQRAEQRERQAAQRAQREEQRNQTANEQLKKKIERECSTMFGAILREYYQDDFTTWQRMSSTTVTVTRLDDDGYALISARIEVDAPASLQRPGEPRVKKRGGATFERTADGRYFITRVTLDQGDLRFVESEYLKDKEIKLSGVEITLGDREE